MRVVVTGAAGFVGSRLCHRLLDDDVTVVGVDRVGASPRERLARAWAALTTRPGFHAVIAELTADDIDLPRLLHGADAVVHAAGRAGMRPSWDEYPAYLADNVDTTARVAHACVAAGVGRLVYLSSSSVYGRLAIGDEARPTAPISPYGVSKLAAEATVRAYAEAKGLSAVVLRLFSVYGPWQRPDMGVHSVVQAALSGGSFELHGDGAQSRSMTYVDDAVAGIMHALDQGVPGETYNIAGATASTMQEVIDEVSRLVGRVPDVRPVAEPPGNQLHTSADISRAALGLGYAPKVGLTEGLARQIAWQREAS